MFRIRYALAVLSLVLLAVSRAPATTYTLTDGNSVLSVNDTDPRGAYSWTVDGVDLLYQQWFWYRVGNTAEQSLDKLPLTKATLLGDSECGICELDLLYSGSGFTVEVKYSLQGGQPGSNTGDVGEQIRINNYRNTSLDFHFYQYSDFNLNQVDGRDTVVIDPSYHEVLQQPVSGTGRILSETTLNQRPNHAEAGVYSTTVDRLNDSVPTVLNDVLQAGPANVTWAFEWDHVIPRYGTFLISKDKLLAPVPVPEPVSLILVGMTVLFTARRFRAASV